MIGKNGKVYLIDFGIARHFTAGKQHDTLKFGTYGYAPPELYAEEQTEIRSDLFSLGAPPPLPHGVSSCRSWAKLV
jgi:serine/threonine-protein kinase